MPKPMPQSKMTASLHRELIRRELKESHARLIEAERTHKIWKAEFNKAVRGAGVIMRRDLLKERNKWIKTSVAFSHGIQFQMIVETNDLANQPVIEQWLTDNGWKIAHVTFSIDHDSVSIHAQ